MGSFGALCKISDVKILKGHGSLGFNTISTKLYGKLGNQGGIHAAITLFGDPPKTKTFMVLLNVTLLTQDHMGNFNMGVNGKIMK